MGKNELKKELELYKNINSELSERLVFLLIGKENYIKILKEDPKNLNTVIKKNIDNMNDKNELLKKRLFNNYSHIKFR